MVFPAMSHFLSVEIRFAPLVVYDYSRLYIGFILFYIRMCIRHTEYIYMVCNLCFYASKNQSYEILTFYTPIDADWLVRDVSMIMFYRGLTGGAVCRV